MEKKSLVIQYFAYPMEETQSTLNVWWNLGIIRFSSNYYLGSQSKYPVLH
jgi:hypothetical protein